MNCRKARSLLSAFSKGELSHSENDKLLQHLDSCEGCREEKATVDQINSAVTSLPRQDLSDDFNMKLFEKIHNAPRSERAAKAHMPASAPSWITYRIKFFAPIAALAAVMVLTFVMFGSAVDPTLNSGPEMAAGDVGTSLSTQPVAASRPINGLRGLKLEQSMLESLSVEVLARNDRMLQILSDEKKARFGQLPENWILSRNVQAGGGSSRYVLPPQNPDRGLVRKVTY